MFATIAWAETLEQIPLHSAIDVLNIDLNDDGWVDRVILYDLEDDAGVSFYLRETENNRLVHKATLADTVWSGVMAGTTPSLELNSAGSVLVKSENSAIGRNRWEQIITIAYRNNALRVVGYTYNWYDTLNLEDNGQCDINYLSGKARYQKAENPEKWFGLVGSAQPINAWYVDGISQICFEN
jgi:hypothetical protein